MSWHGGRGGLLFERAKCCEQAVMNDVIPGFTKFLAACWKKAPEQHSYRLPIRGRLSRWRDFNGKWDGDRQIWTVRSLSEALEKYFWPPGDFALNREKLNELRDSLLKAIQERNDRLAECLVYKIFNWGGVSLAKDGASRTWVGKQARKQALCSELDRAVQLLKRTDAPLDDFRPGALRMNSSMTKVYALADPEQFLIIYDGRVGAALGHLARLYLEQSGQGTVPEDLRFRWGAKQPPPPRGQIDPRNPSRGRYVFPALFSPYPYDLQHAEMVRQGSVLVSECVRLIMSPRSRVSPRELEAALFMWGYRVNEER
jgi:hypothetical protein